jgi:hypothetical protein
LLPPLLPLRLHVGDLLFGGVRDFFYRQPQPGQGAVDGTEVDRHAQLLAQLRQGGVGRGGDQLGQALAVGVVEFARGAAAVRPGGEARPATANGPASSGW